AESIKTVITNASAEVQGMKLEGKIILTSKNQSSTVMTMMGMEVNKQVFDGEKGYVSAQGQRQDFGEDEIEANKLNSYPIPELYLDNPKLIGAEMVNGKPAYVLEVSEGNKWYYDQENGLKVKTEITAEVQGQQFTQSTYFSNYKEIEGIKMPYTTTLDIAGQEIELNVSEYKINEEIDEEIFK